MPLKTLNPFSISILSKDEIPTRLKKVQNSASATYSLLLFCLSYNLSAVSIIWFHGVIESQTLYLAIAYLLLGVPAAHFSWRRELSLAFNGDDRFSFARLFVVYMIHIGFCLFAWLDPYEEKSLTGLASGMMVYFDDGLALIGILYFIGSMLFFVEYVMSIWVISNVHKLYIQGVFSYENYGGDYYFEATNGSINV